MTNRTKRLFRILVLTCFVAGLTAAAALAVTPSQGTLAGSSNQSKIQDHSVTLRVNKNHKIVHFVIGWRAKCQQPGKFWTAKTEIGKAAITNDGNGVFHSDGSYTSQTDNGFTGRTTIHLKGHFTDATHAQGSWKATVKVSKNGNKIDTCSAQTNWHVAG